MPQPKDIISITKAQIMSIAKLGITKKSRKNKNLVFGNKKRNKLARK